MLEFDATLLELITVAAPVGWERAVGMSAASVGMADMGGSGTGRTRGLLKKLCFHRYRLSARAVRALVAVEMVIEAVSPDIEAEPGKKIVSVLIFEGRFCAERDFARVGSGKTAEKRGFAGVF